MPPRSRHPLTRLDLVLWGWFAALLALLCVPRALEARELAAEARIAARYGDLPVAKRFDFPVGGPDAAGYHRAQRFGENLHLGEDWNRDGRDDLDYGDPVTSIAEGRVTFATHAGAPWGNVVRVVHRVVHRVQRGGRASYVESLYAHLASIEVAVGDRVALGQRLGTIGDADGRWGPHLHLEVRRAPDLPLGPGYSSRSGAWLEPTAFILAHR